jgi:Toxin co-regulated pilus biosynthesis protein Q
MNFWIRTTIFGVILLGLAYFLFANQESLFEIIESTEAEMSVEGAATATKKEKVVQQPREFAKKALKTDNAAAQGLSRFYANLHGEYGEEAKIRNNIVFLPDPTGNLTEILEAKAKITRPLRVSWRGNTEARPFRKGETLFQKLSEYAENEGLEVLWWLNKDLIIKDPFRINKELLYTAYLIGNAVQGHFPNGVVAYFCYNQRSIVIIEEDIEYLQKECELLTPETLKQYKRRQ